GKIYFSLCEKTVAIGNLRNRARARTRARPLAGTAYVNFGHGHGLYEEKDVKSCSRSCPPLKISYKDKGREFFLRPLDVTDVFVLQEAFEKSEKELSRFMPWAHFPHGHDQEVQRLAKARHYYFSGTDLLWGVFDTRTDEFLTSIAARSL